MRLNLEWSFEFYLKKTKSVRSNLNFYILEEAQCYLLSKLNDNTEAQEVKHVLWNILTTADSETSKKVALLTPLQSFSATFFKQKASPDPDGEAFFHTLFGEAPALNHAAQQSEPRAEFVTIKL